MCRVQFALPSENPQLILFVQLAIPHSTNTLLSFPTSSPLHLFPSSLHHPLLPGLSCPSLPFPAFSLLWWTGERVDRRMDGHTNARTDGTQFYILGYIDK